jgi:hypothetical protein
VLDGRLASGYEIFVLRYLYTASNGNDVDSLRSGQNNLYVSVELNYSGSRNNMLRARGTFEGGQEAFEIVLR